MKRELTAYGREVKKALVDHDMTLSKLSELVGTSEKYLGLITHGERANSKYVPIINQILGLSPTEIEERTA